MSKGTRGFGPGFIISAAFVGPGTVITCTVAGIRFGPALLWTLLFAGATTYVLQEMSLRLSLASDNDLAGSIGRVFPGKYGSTFAWLVALGIVTGCIAYQSGNLIGGASGTALFFDIPTNVLVMIQAAVAFILLWTGTYALIEKALMALVALMGISFIGIAALNPPAILDLMSGLFVPTLPEGSLLTVIALVGTTVVPYNLFLHARIAREKWLQESGQAAISWARKDLLFGIAIGIAVSLAIMASSATGLQGASITNVSAMADPLKDRFGDFGALIFGVGLWAAGLTSAITAPLAAAYTVMGASGYGKKREAILFRVTWIVVLFSGVIFATSGINPVALIVAAQAFNGMILPLAAFFLIIALNKKALGQWKNGIASNLVGAIVLLVVLLLAARYILRSMGLW